MSGLRTTTGCWTCRIRKKKCDDIQPVCGPCSIRQLTCHGFGSKPTWMDSAENQKAEVERIKRAVNQNFRSRRAFRTSKSTDSSRSNPKVSETQQTFPSKFSSQQDFTVSSDENVAGTGRLGLVKLGGTPAIFSDPDSDLQHQSPNISTQMPLHASMQSDATSNDPSHVSNAKAYPFAFHPDAPRAENEHELTLILYYLDNIFPLQYYFYQPASSERGRGWLLGLLLRAKSSYYTALAFSCVAKIRFLHRGNPSIQQQLFIDLDRYHSRALSELQAQLDILPTISGYEHLRLGVEILACMVQLMSIEVFRETKEYEGWKDDWEVHLDAAGTLLSVIGTNLRISSDSPASASDGEEETGQKHAGVGTPNLLPLNEIAGLDFFMTAFMWSDICRCASSGPSSSSRNSFSYLTYLEEDRVHLDSIMGCRNWAMIAIKKISNLEAWKHEMQQCRILSIPELSRQAAELEASLHLFLGDLPKDWDVLTAHEQECNLVTQLYATSALIYLAVVCSGNSHLLPEVRSSVTKTLNELKALPHHLLIRVSWPYCVAGTMADDSQKEDFRRLLADAHAAGHLLGTLWNGLEIMEEFWKLREDLEFMQMANKCAWELAMDSLGAKILLI